MLPPCNNCGVSGASGKHLCTSAQASKAVRVLPVPDARCGFHPNREAEHYTSRAPVRWLQYAWKPLRWRQNRLKG